MPQLLRNIPRDPAFRLLVGALLVLAVGFAPIACSAARQVSPATRDAAVKLAFDEFRYQCEANPPNDARLQAACLVALSATDSASSARNQTSEQTPNGEARTHAAEPEPVQTVTPPSDAGSSFDPTPGNAVRMVRK